MDSDIVRLDGNRHLLAHPLIRQGSLGSMLLDSPSLDPHPAPIKSLGFGPFHLQPEDDLIAVVMEHRDDLDEVLCG